VEISLEGVQRVMEVQIVKFDLKKGW